jgi:hypothetical protein
LGCAISHYLRVTDLEVLKTLAGREVDAREVEAFRIETELVRRDWLSGVGGRPYALVSREVHHAKESDSKDGRADLGRQISSGEDLPGLREVLRELLEREVNDVKLQSLVRALGGSVSREGNETAVTVYFDRAVGWPVEWGGEWSPEEVRRSVYLRANHARWRDRRNRRLVEYRVSLEEIWADFNS